MAYGQLPKIPNFFKKVIVMIISLCLFYNCTLTLSIMEKFGATQSIFIGVLSLAPEFKEYLETNFLMLGVASLFKPTFAALPNSLQGLI